MGATRGRGSGRRFLLLVIVLVAGAAKFAAAQQVSPPGPGPNYFGLNNLNSSTVIVIAILVTAFFFLGIFSIYIRRCAGGQLGGPGDYPGGGRPGGDTFASGASRSRRMRGLDPAVLETFPIMAYADVKLHKAGEGALECAVCLSEFDDDETLRLLPKCSHAFHTDCIDAWLASHDTCPVCRENLVPDAEAATAVRTAVSTTTEQDVPAPEQPAQEAAAAPEQVTVVVSDAEETEEERIRREEAAELMRIGSVKRALRNKSGRRPAQFPRSHTTGHSLAGAPLAAAGESIERFTLRLPEHVLREVVAAGKLRRTTSLQAFRTGGDRSTRRGFGGARAARSVRLGQSGRWPNMLFLERPFTERLPAWGSVRRGEADAPGKVAGDGKACPLPLGGPV